MAIKEISKDSNKNDKIICRYLLEEVKSNNNKIEIIATDGNYSYCKVINKGYNKDCIEHIISKSDTRSRKMMCLHNNFNLLF